MRSFLLSIVAGAVLAIGSIAVPSTAEAQNQLPYIAAATNDLGYGYGEGFSMEQARQIAIANCQSKTGRQCIPAMSTSVHRTWYLAVVDCGHSYAVGASQHNWYVALSIAERKVGGFRCRSVLEQ